MKIVQANNSHKLTMTEREWRDIGKTAGWLPWNEETALQDAPETFDTIIEATITDMPQTVLDPPPEVWVKTEDDKKHLLFSFDPTEISFTPDEFIGLTLEQAKKLQHRKAQPV